MKIFIYTFLGCFIFADAFSAGLVPVNKLHIINIQMHSNQDTLAPAKSGTVLLKLDEEMQWSVSSQCNKTHVVIRSEDKHLIAAALAAYTSSRPIKPYIDDDYGVEPTYCYLRVLTLTN
jgi:hypothetical protein